MSIQSKQLPVDDILQRDLVNIGRLTAQGKPLTDAQLARLEKARHPSAPPAPEYVANKTELAELFGVTRQALHDMCKRGFVFPHKGKQGYNVAKFKENFEEFRDRDSGAKVGTARDEKVRLECERLKVNIDIDNERLKQAEIETRRQQSQVVTIEDHRATLDIIREMYLTGLDQIVESVSTKARSAKIRDMLQTAVDSLRRRLSERLNQ